MKKRIISMLLVAVMALGLVACGGSESAEESAESTEAQTETKDTFTYAVLSDTGNTLNYFTTDTREGMTFIKLINTPLFTMLPDGSLHYYMAESFETEDGVTYTCKLNPDAKWSDGEALTAEDVVFTFEQYVAQGFGAGVFDTAKITAVDDTTVEFVLETAQAAFPEDVAGVYLLPKHVFEGKDSLDMDMTSDTIVGCGAYMFDSYESGSYLRAVANPNYVHEAAKIPNVVFQIVADDNTAKAALQNGEVDAWVGTASSLDGLEDFTVTPYSEGRVAYVRLNRVADSMQDKDYRTGILKALNREDIMVAAYSSLDYATLSYSFLPTTNSYYTEDLEKYDQDVEAAKELVAGGATTLKICYIGANQEQTNMAQVIKAELKEIGIEVELCGLEQAAYVETAYDNEDKTYDMYLGGYIMTVDPAGYDGMFATGNMINYANEELDALFAEGRTETDAAKRAEIFTEAQQMVADEALFYPFGTNLRILVTNPALKGMEDAAKFVPIYTFDDYSQLYFE